MWMWLSLAAHAAPATIPAGATAIDLAAEAELLFQVGVDEYQSANFDAALRHLLHSQRLSPNRNTAFNIARCYEQLDQLNLAWRFYADADATGDAKNAPVEEALARLQPRVAQVSVVTDPPGATVFLERRDLGARGTTPVILALPPGPHRILLEHPESQPAQATAKASAGRKVESYTVLEPLPAAHPPPQWVSSTLRSGDLVVMQARPASCEILPSKFQGAGQWTNPAEMLPGPPPGAIAAPRFQSGLALEVVIRHGDDSLRTSHLAVKRAGVTSTWLADAAPLHTWLFDRCAPLPEQALGDSIEGLSSRSQRLDVAAVLLEATSTVDGMTAAARCGRGNCEALQRLLGPTP